MQTRKNDEGRCMAQVDYIITLVEHSLGDFRQMGGPGSGHHRHRGIKGRRGGSTPSRGGAVIDYGDLDIGYESVFWNANAKRMQGEVKELFEAQDLTDSERRALQDYTTKGVYRIQSALRSGDIPPDVKRKVKRLDSALAKNEAPRDMYVYRSKAAERRGDVITDKGYMSTSLSKQVAASFAATSFGERNYEDVIRVKIPKGANVLYTGIFGRAEAKQFEVLLPRDSSLKRISGKEYELV